MALEQIKLMRQKTGHAELYNFARPLKSIKRAGDLIRIHQRIRAMDQQLIESFDTKASQGVHYRGYDVFATGVVVLDAMCRPGLRHERDSAFSDQLDSRLESGIGLQR